MGGVRGPPCQERTGDLGGRGSGGELALHRLWALLCALRPGGSPPCLEAQALRWQRTPKSLAPPTDAALSWPPGARPTGHSSHGQGDGEALVPGVSGQLSLQPTSLLVPTPWPMWSPGPTALSAQHLSPVPGRCQQPLCPNGRISGGLVPGPVAGPCHRSRLPPRGARRAWACTGCSGAAAGPLAPRPWHPGAVPSPDSLLGKMQLKMDGPRGLALSRCTPPDGCHASPGLTGAGGKSHTEGQSLGQGGAQPCTVTLGTSLGSCQGWDAHLPGPARSCTPHTRHPGAPVQGRAQRARCSRQ